MSERRRARAKEEELSPEEAAHRCMEECGARCCRYITILLPPPRRRAELDEWSWFLAHENVSIYFSGGRWHMEVRTPCRYLDERNACTIYERRPDVCRIYSLDSCEYTGRVKPRYQFNNKEEFDRWWERRRARERRRRRERAGKARKP